MTQKKEDIKKEVPVEKSKEEAPKGPHIPKDVQEKLDKIKTKLDSFKKEVTEKFDKYIMGISLLPSMATQPKPGLGFEQTINIPGQKQPSKNDVNILVLVDDSDSQKMTKYELKNKLSAIISKIAKETDSNFLILTIILSELWQNCFDQKYELTKLVASGAPIFDRGMLSAIKISEVHKTMVLKKFEKYIVSYVLAGSLVQGKASPDSDIDVFVVIDDTDVKKMTRVELKDKLRAIIIGMGIEAGDITGIRKKINIQVYILTDFWDNIKEANPIIFTFLRDGIPFYDRGIFMPWKQLLKMGKIKPSPEAIDMFMSSGDQMVSRVQYKLKGIGMEDTFYAILTPSQAALMLYGVPPPTPKETPAMMRDIFVKKEKLLEDDIVKILERNIQLRKDLEHGSKKELTGKEVDVILADSQKYLKRIKKLFKQIDKIKEEESVLHTYEHALTVTRDVLKLEGNELVKDKKIVEVFGEEMIHKGKAPQKYHRMLKQIVKAKEDYDKGKLTKTDINNVKKDSSVLIKFMIEYVQRKRGREIEKTKIRVKHGKKFGEVILLDKTAFIIHDIDAEEKKVTTATIKVNGSLIDYKESSMDDLEKALMAVEIPVKTFIKQPIFENLKEIFGKDVEVSVHY